MNIEDTILTPHPGKIPSTPLLWPTGQHTENKIQQTKSSAKPSNSIVLPTTQPAKSAVPPRTTPANVSHVRVVTKPAVNGMKSVTVQFNHPGGDQYFAGANVYLRKSHGEPVMVASVAKSPATFTVPVSSAPHSVFVSSTGNWGSTDVLSSPSRRVRLI